MNTISINKFRDNIKNFVEKVVTEHIPLKVTRRNNDDLLLLAPMTGIANKKHCMYYKTAT